MGVLTPNTGDELAQAMADTAGRGETIRLGGAFSKDGMAGPLTDAQVTLSTAGLKRVLDYEPADLTISVEAGMPYAELQALLARNGQMIPLDPPFEASGTIGGVVAANLSGPRRKLFGTARDMIIGMSFATLEGKRVQSGGMVVKNVAGLDMAKLMIGSFGTLAAILSVNFRLYPLPPATRTLILRFDSLEKASERRDVLLQAQWQPQAFDFWNPAAAKRLGLDGWVLAAQASGSPAVLERYSRLLPDAETMEGESESELWHKVREFSPGWMSAAPEGAVVRVSHPLAELRQLASGASGPVVARAGSGVSYLYFASAEEAGRWRGPGRAAVEFAPQAMKPGMTLWPDPGSGFAMMEKVKKMFDPQHLLNRGRLYGRL